MQDTVETEAPQSDMASQAYLNQLTETFEKLPHD